VTCPIRSKSSAQHPLRPAAWIGGAGRQSGTFAGRAARPPRRLDRERVVPARELEDVVVAGVYGDAEVIAGSRGHGPRSRRRGRAARDSGGASARARLTAPEIDVPVSKSSALEAHSYSAPRLIAPAPPPPPEINALSNRPHLGHWSRSSAPEAHRYMLWSMEETALCLRCLLPYPDHVFEEMPIQGSAQASRRAARLPTSPAETHSSARAHLDASRRRENLQSHDCFSYDRGHVMGKCFVTYFTIVDSLLLCR
jgi:hypothetical protein